MNRIFVWYNKIAHASLNRSLILCYYYYMSSSYNRLTWRKQLTMAFIGGSQYYTAILTCMRCGAANEHEMKTNWDGQRQRALLNFCITLLFSLHCFAAVKKSVEKGTSHLKVCTFWYYWNVLLRKWVKSNIQVHSCWMKMRKQEFINSQYYRPL